MMTSEREVGELPMNQKEISCDFLGLFCLNGLVKALLMEVLFDCFPLGEIFLQTVCWKVTRG